jgi:hypothetical protein
MPGLETTEYELDHWKGLDVYSSPTDTDPHFLSEVQNVDFDEDGVIEKRRGFMNYSTLSFSGPINMIWDYSSQQGFSGTSDTKRVVIVGGATLNVVKNYTVAGETIEFSSTVSNALHYAVASNNGVAYISNEAGGEYPKMLCCLSSSWVFRSAELEAPSSTASMTTGTTGSLSGDYKLRYTYEDVFGNESNMSPEPAAITLHGTCSGTVWTGKNLDFTVSPSSDVTVEIINIYLLIPQSSIYQWTMTLSNSGATGGSVIQSNAWIQEGEPGPIDNWPIDKAKYVAIFNDMLVTSGDPSLPDLVHVSDVGFHRQFGAESYDRVTSGDGQPVRGFGRSYNELVIAKSKSLFRAIGSDPETFAARPYNPEYGALGQPSIVYFFQRLAFFSEDGIYADNALTPDEISQRIRNLMRRLNPANLSVTPPKQYAITDKYYKRIIWAVREAAGAGANDSLYVWNYERNTWTRWTGVSCTALGTIQNNQDYQFVFGGDSNGKMFLVCPPNGASPNYDNYSGTASAISAYVLSPWINIPKSLGIQSWNKVRTEMQHITIFAGGEPNYGSTASLTLTTEFYTDFSTTVRGTFTTTHSTSTWPTATVDPKTFTLTGKYGTLNWFRYKISNAELGVHFKIHKIMFMFKLKPLVSK